MVADFPQADNINASLFADDSGIWENGTSIKQIHNYLQAQLDTITKWCEAWGFIINVKETVSVRFTKKQNKCLPTAFHSSSIGLSLLTQSSF